MHTLLDFVYTPPLAAGATFRLKNEEGRRCRACPAYRLFMNKYIKFCIDSDIFAGYNIFASNSACIEFNLMVWA